MLMHSRTCRGCQRKYEEELPPKNFVFYLLRYKVLIAGQSPDIRRALKPPVKSSQSPLPNAEIQRAKLPLQAPQITTTAMLLLSLFSSLLKKSTFCFHSSFVLGFFFRFLLPKIVARSGQTVQQLRVYIIIQNAPALYQMPNKCLQLQFQEIRCHLLDSLDICIHTCT